jgi:CMP-N-acetylneuraminic acid synthetase
VARAQGADVPFTRPADLAGDQARMAPVLRHAVLEMEAADAERYDWVLLLQPTSPFRTLEDVRAALRLAEAGGCDSVISVVRVFDVHPVLMKKIEQDRLVPFCVAEPEGTRRQEYDPPAYMRNGAIYLTRRDVLVERGSIWGDVIRPYVMPEDRSVSIDTELHLKLVDLLLRER